MAYSGWCNGCWCWSCQWREMALVNATVVPRQRATFENSHENCVERSSHWNKTTKNEAGPTTDARLLYITLIGLFTTFLRAVARCMDAAIFDLGSLSLAFLYWVVCVFSLGTFTEVSLVKPEDSLSPLFSAIHYSKSWVWKLVDIIWPTHRLRYGNLYVVPDQSIGYAMEACKQCLTKA